MNETPQDAWFYTREGERIGPVSFADLRARVAEAALDPRLDMVWSQGMAEWKPAGEIEGLFEKRAMAEESETAISKADPYTAPKEPGITAEMSREGGWPGARRRSFLIMTILFPVIWNFAFAFGGGLLGSQLGPEIMTFISLGAGLVPLMVGIYFGLMRLVNLGMSRWWYLANFVPFLNLWVGYRCFACPAGYAFHKKLDGPGVALAILYWLLVVVVIVAVIAVAALMLGAVDDPGLQDQVREAVRVLRERNAKP